MQDGLIDLDAPVATLWPEFAAGGKAAVPVRQLLSHQAGLLGVDGGYGYDDLFGHAPLAARLGRPATALGAGERTRLPRPHHRRAGRRVGAPGDGWAAGGVPAGARDGATGA